MVSSLSKVLEWPRRGEPEVGEDEEDEDKETGKLQLLLLLVLQPPPPSLQLPPQGSLSFSQGTGSSPRSERTRLSGTLRPSFSSMSLRSGSGQSSMTSRGRGQENSAADGAATASLGSCGESSSPLPAPGSLPSADAGHRPLHDRQRRVSQPREPHGTRRVAAAVPRPVRLSSRTVEISFSSFLATSPQS